MFYYNCSCKHWVASQKVLKCTEALKHVQIAEASISAVYPSNGSPTLLQSILPWILQIQLPRD